MNDIVFGYLHCGRKIRFRSEYKAQRFADQVNKRHQDKVYPYFCKICDGWHNGHKAKKEKYETYMAVGTAQG